MHRYYFFLPFLCYMTFCSFASAESAADAAAILKAATERAASFESYTCKMKSEVRIGAQATVSVGTMAYLKPGFLLMTSGPADPSAAGTRTRVVSDGRTTYNEIEQEGAIVVVKSQAGGGADGAGVAGAGQSLNEMLAQFAQIYDFQLAPEAEGQAVDGQAMHLLIGKIREGSLANLMGAPPTPEAAQGSEEYLQLIERLMDSIRLLIGKEDLLLHRFEVTAAPASSGPAEILPSTATTLSEFQINAPLTPANFLYTPPEGAQVIDTTRPQRAPAESGVPGAPPAPLPRTRRN